MQELIKIQTVNGAQVVSARELHTFLEVSERFANWCERMFAYGFEENVDYSGCKVFNTLAKQELQDFALSLDCAKEISMLQRNEKGKIARKYFIDCEKQLKEKPALSRLELLELAIESEKKTLLLERQVKLNQPYVDYVKKVLVSQTSYTATQVAKELGYSAVVFNQLLVDNKIQYKFRDSYVLYTIYADKNYTCNRTHTYKDGNGVTHSVTQMEWTEKGRYFLHSIVESKNKSISA